MHMPLTVFRSENEILTIALGFSCVCSFLSIKYFKTEGWNWFPFVYLEKKLLLSGAPRGLLNGYSLGTFAGTIGEKSNTFIKHVLIT